MSTCQVPVERSDMDAKNSRSVLDVFVGKGFFWIFSGLGRLEWYRDLRSGQPSIVVPRIKKGDSVKLLWPNRSRNRFFLETDTCNLYYYAIGMKKWQRVWRLYGDELASVFYDDDPSDEFRTDRIYLLTKNGHLLSCEAVVGHVNGQETLDISAFSCMMSVFPGVDIVDFLITRSFKRQFTAVELNSLSEELSTSYEFLESVWEKSKSKPDMWPPIDPSEKDKGNMFYSCQEIANDLQKLFFSKQEQLNELVKTLNSIVVTEPLKKKDKKKAAPVDASLNMEQLKKVKTECAAIVRDFNFSKTVRNKLDQLEKQLSRDNEALWNMIRDQEVINTEVMAAQTDLNAELNYLYALKKVKLDEGSDHARFLESVEQRVHAVADAIPSYARHKNSNLLEMGIQAMQMTLKTDREEIGKRVREAKADMAQINMLLRHYKVTPAESKTLCELETPLEIIPLVKKRIDDSIKAFSMLKTRWNVLKEILPVVRALQSALYRVNGPQAGGIDQVVNNMFVLTSRGLYSYSSAETPMVMLQQIQKRAHLERDAKFRKSGEEPNALKNFEFAIETLSERQFFTYPACLSVGVGEEQEIPTFILYDANDKEKPFWFCEFRLGSSSWFFARIEVKTMEGAPPSGAEQLFPKKILFYARTASGLIVVDETCAREFLIRKEKRGSDVVYELDGQALWQQSLDHGGGILGAEYGRDFGLVLFNSLSVVRINRSATDRFLFKKFLEEENFEMAIHLAETDDDIRAVKYGTVMNKLGEFLIANLEKTKTEAEKEKMWMNLVSLFEREEMRLYDVMLLLLNKQVIGRGLVKTIERQRKKKDNQSLHLTPDFFQWAIELLVVYLNKALNRYHWKRQVQREMICLFLVMLYMSRLCGAVARKTVDEGLDMGLNYDNPYSIANLPEFIDFCNFASEYADIIPKELAYEIVQQYPLSDGLLILSSCGQLSKKIVDNPMAPESAGDPSVRDFIDWPTFADVLVQKTISAIAVNPNSGESGEKMFPYCLTTLCRMYAFTRERGQMTQDLLSVFNVHLMRLLTCGSRFDVCVDMMDCLDTFQRFNVPPSATCSAILCGIHLGDSKDIESKFTKFQEYLKKFYPEKGLRDGEKAGVSLLAALMVRNGEEDKKDVINFITDRCGELDVDAVMTYTEILGKNTTDTKVRAKKIVAKLFEVQKLSMPAFRVILGMSDDRVPIRAAKLIEQSGDGDSMELMCIAAHQHFMPSNEKWYAALCRRLLSRSNALVDLEFTRLIRYIPKSVLNCSMSGAPDLMQSFLTKHEPARDEAHREIEKTWSKIVPGERAKRGYVVRVSPFATCILCKAILNIEPYQVYYCQHKVHVKCLMNRIEALYPECEKSQVLKECPFCGDTTVAMMNRSHDSDMLSSPYAMTSEIYHARFREEYSDDEDDEEPIIRSRR